MRIFGEIKPDTYYRPRAGAYGIFWHQGQILLTFQADPFFEWQLPGGGIDAGESPKQALHREGFEETGWSLNVTRKVTIYKRYDFLEGYEFYAEKICHIYEGLAVNRIGAATEAGHIGQLVDPIDAINMLANRPDSALLQNLIRYPNFRKI